MQRFLMPHNHPFRLLLYLEWILLGIALLEILLPRPSRYPAVFSVPWGVLFCIVLMAVMGMRLPMGKAPLSQGLYTSLGFGLSWLAVIWGGRGRTFFPALLLVVVMRACLLLPWRGRILVALLAYSSFLLRMVQFLLDLTPGHPGPLRRFRHLAPDHLQAAVVNFALNSALLFGLVLIFVLFMVSAVVTERQSRQKLAEANDRLRRYTLLIENQATLQERHRIAREMHDSVGHALTAQSIQLENVALWLPQDLSKATDHLSKARQLSKEALRNVRQSVASLRTDPLQGQTLGGALATLVQDFERTTAIQITSEVSLSANLPKEMATALYRVIQEALTNVSKHSEAKQVHLELSDHPTQLHLSLTDNGRGFDLEANRSGFGLQSMRERTEALGGTFHLRSSPGQGCQLQIDIPKPGGLL